ncbi:TlpA family protein disulfide reductase [Marinomonas agarivorans]|nr:TlpA family protein disulfide reductase [Marinomonas agarivorans]
MGIKSVAAINLIYFLVLTDIFSNKRLKSPIALFIIALLAITPFTVNAEIQAVDNAPQAPEPTLHLPLVQDNQPSSSDKALADYKGKVVLVDFWASWCGPCRHSFPWMNRLLKKHAKEDFAIVAINVDSKAQFAHRFLDVTPAQFDVLLDPAGQLQDAFGVLGMPTSFLLDRQGRVRATHVGFNDSKIPAYEADIASLLEETN